MYPAPFWTWTGLKRQILPFTTVTLSAGSLRHGTTETQKASLDLLI